MEDETAWVQSGTTLGELYYAIANRSKVHGFPAGSCATIGIGRHLSGGVEEVQALLLSQHGRSSLSKFHQQLPSLRFQRILMMVVLRFS
ncbi:hypothetical protein HN51_044770 [Arachis hypogaea]